MSRHESIELFSTILTCLRPNLRLDNQIVARGIFVHPDRHTASHEYLPPIRVSTPTYLGPVTSTYTVCNTERYPFSILTFGVTAMPAAVGRLQFARHALDGSLSRQSAQHLARST